MGKVSTGLNSLRSLCIDPGASKSCVNFRITLQDLLYWCDRPEHCGRSDDSEIVQITNMQDEIPIQIAAQKLLAVILQEHLQCDGHLAVTHIAVTYKENYYQHFKKLHAQMKIWSTQHLKLMKYLKMNE